MFQNLGLISKSPSLNPIYLGFFDNTKSAPKSHSNFYFWLNCFFVKECSIFNHFSIARHYIMKPTQCNFIHCKFSNNNKNAAISTMSCVTISMFITIIVHMQHWFIVTIVIIGNNGTMKKRNLPTTCFIDAPMHLLKAWSLTWVVVLQCLLWLLIHTPIVPTIWMVWWGFWIAQPASDGDVNESEKDMINKGKEGIGPPFGNDWSFFLHIFLFFVLFSPNTLRQAS